MRSTRRAAFIVSAAGALCTGVGSGTAAAAPAEQGTCGKFVADLNAMESGAGGAVVSETAIAVPGVAGYATTHCDFATG